MIHIADFKDVKKFSPFLGASKKPLLDSIKSVTKKNFNKHSYFFQSP